MDARRSSTPKALIALGAFTLIAAAIPADTIQTQESGPMHYQAANIVDFTTLAPVAGAATLLRAPNGLSALIATSGLDADSAYSVWWVVWNEPELCTAPCSIDDLGIPGNSFFNAAGFVTDIDGTGNVTFSIDAGKLPEGLEVIIPGGLRPGNGFGAEVHVAIRSHGAILTGLAAEQISKLLGGCSVNTCENQQVVMFPPVL